MTTDLFFAPAPPQTAPSSFPCERSGSFASARNSITEATGISKSNKHENFLNTLKKASRDQDTTEGSRSTKSPARQRSAKSDRQPETDDDAVQKSLGDEHQTDSMSFMNPNELGMDDQPPMAAELKDVIALLEALGWTGFSDDQQVVQGEGLTPEKMPLLAAKYQKLLATLNQMIGEVQSKDLEPGNELSTGLEQLRLLIVRALTADPSMSNSEAPKDGLNQNQSSLPVELASWVKGIIQGQGNGGGNTEGGSTEKPVDGPTGIPADSDTGSKGPNSLKIGEQFDNALQPEHTDKTDGSRLNPEMRNVAENDGTAKNFKVLDKLPVKSDNTNRNAPGGHSSASATGGRETVPENSLPGDTSGGSKAINEVSAGKENYLKADPVPGGDAASQIAKTEAGANDSGQLASQNQTSERTIETASATKESDTAQRELRSQTMEQIVRRAVFQIKNGQQEARIDLKPDFMGHVRLQVTTENQQVTVKILTEFGYVKDMIENNIHQLKTDLQQQGLDVDKFDVSVSRDANGNKNHQENTEHAGRRFREDEAGDNRNSTEDRPDQKARSSRKSVSISTVDFFA
ncbi:MAG: flagellar hook-length control protein FliK [Desulfobacterales bacterium]